MKKLYVGNLSVETDQDDLLKLFSRKGVVVSADLVCDQWKKSSGYGFVEMENQDDADKAIESLDGTEFKGRHIRVKKASKEAPPPGMKKVSIKKKPRPGPDA